MDELNDRSARLEMNARGYRPNPDLDRAADLFYTDRAAYDALPQSVKSAASTYADMREHHRAAVAAGVIREANPDGQ